MKKMALTTLALGISFTAMFGLSSGTAEASSHNYKTVAEYKKNEVSRHEVKIKGKWVKCVVSQYYRREVTTCTKHKGEKKVTHWVSYSKSHSHAH
ncbi:hypothetical protein [Priestia taiwanensis]|uniref:Uncharacterized protein n=1 Tax=Priestia taiwanensis TaxID=1347902 RepID=A0A917ETJ1_9BACI|nr:hypothetical protein [Priestia taiwanensis]MBM7364661.1 hypothetical protein [Priestia taiwanensis]GGE78611.1 hypothetical protein GCM10007140_30260 [Priestia taiwanensis]